MTQKSSRAADYFNQLYETNPDPWNFSASDYERQKYDATIAALQGRAFFAGLEVGCSIGVLTARLAAHCGRLLAIDIAPAALAAAQRHCTGLDNITFEQRRVPEEWPAQTFDLIVLSEVLYFLSREDIARVAEQARASIAPEGIVLLVNYTEDIDEPCGGEEAASLFIAAAAPALSLIRRDRREKFRIDVLRAPPMS